VFSSLTAAFEHGAQMEQYLLVSETEEQFTVYEPFDGLPRQFARALVAEALGVQERASWRDFPNVASAVENSKHVRRILDRAAATR
jgi:hypothetical protein